MVMMTKSYQTPNWHTFLHAEVVHFTWTRGFPPKRGKPENENSPQQPFIWSNNLLPSVSFTHQIIRYESWIPCMSKSHVGSTNWFCCFVGYWYFIDPPFRSRNVTSDSSSKLLIPHRVVSMLWENTTSKDLHLIMHVKRSIRQSHIINRVLYSYYFLLILCKSYHAYYSGTMTFITHDILYNIYIYCICIKNPYQTSIQFPISPQAHWIFPQQPLQFGHPASISSASSSVSISESLNQEALRIPAISPAVFCL